VVPHPAKILCVVGTRPEAVKMAPVIRELRAAPWATVRVLATGQHRRLLDQVLAFFRIQADADLDLMRADQSLSDLTARGLKALDPVLAAEQPSVVLAQGDTTSVFITALACFYRRVPFGHVEAGLRTGKRDSPFPEEMNRVLASRLADLHFAPTPSARDNLLREGTPPERVFVTGNPGIDALQFALRQELPNLPADLSGRPMILVTAHRRENHGPPLLEICQAVLELARSRDLTIVFPVHPNPNVQRHVQERLGGHARIRLTPPLDYPQFVAAMKAAHLILSDSGGVQEEAPALGKPVLVLRETTERPEGVAAGSACLVGTSRQRIVAKVLKLLDDPAAYQRMAKAQNPYGDGRAAPRIVDILRHHFAAQSLSSSSRRAA
jgi:UDP-N-acetylglucosamine 2-epimerase (non-hydrolysing)